jgi:DNA-binding beta-propeller fold protein YncE
VTGAASLLLAAVLASCALEPDAYDPGTDAGIDVTLVPLNVIGGVGAVPVEPGGEMQQLGFAAAVAARAGHVYVVDGVALGLVRIDPFGGRPQLLSRLRDATTQGLYVTDDLVIYVVDRHSRAVIELDDSGHLRRRYSDTSLIPAPVDVAALNWGETILIADELSRRLVMFDRLSNPAGMMNSTLSPVMSAASIGSIAAGNGSIFVLDTASREVTQLDMQGRAVATYGEDAFEAPVAIAADACGRVFVADGHSSGLFVSSYDYQGTSSRAALPVEITAAVADLWIDGNELYVAAGPFGVYVMAIQPGCSGP